MKICTSKFCKNPLKPKSEFGNKKDSKDGLQNWCKECMSEYAKTPGSRSSQNKYRKKPEVAISRRVNSLKRRPTYMIKKWDVLLLCDARTRSTRCGFSKPTITVEWIQELFQKQLGKCHWTGITMVPSSEARSLFQPSLDRLDNSRGYDPDNVVLVCWGANAARGVSTPEKFREWLDAMYNSYSIKKAS